MKAMKTTMADRVSFCRVCSGIIHVKNRRLLFSPAFLFTSELTEILMYEVHQNDGLSKYICLTCFSKFNGAITTQVGLGSTTGKHS